MRREVIGPCTLYLADFREVLASLDFDAIVGDPPYGIEYEASRYRNARFDGVLEGDDRPFDPAPLVATEVPTILWGANNYAERLPRGGWLCWDKRCCEAADRCLGSPFELAWHSDPAKFKILRLQHGGAINADGPNVPRIHPTQKPLRLMEWCLGFVDGETVLDPCMGSGTTMHACIRTGRNGIGVEIDPQHFDTACRRVEKALADQALFVPVVRERQGELVEAAI